MSRDTTDELYELPPGEFVEARNRIAADLKKAGNKEAAAAVKAMAKPTASVWAINHVARHDPAAMRKFLEVSDELREAQTRGSGGGEDGRRTFQELQARQREALDRVVDLATKSLAEAGLGDSRTVLDRVANDLRWGALSDDTRALLADGRLGQDVDPPDFGAMLGLAGGGGTPAAKPKKVEKSEKSSGKAAAASEKDDDDEDEARDREAEAARREQARFLRASLNAAQAQEARARTLATRAHQARERAERSLDAAREDLVRREAEAAEAARMHAEADEAADAHAKEVARLTGELAEIED